MVHVNDLEILAPGLFDRLGNTECEKLLPLACLPMKAGKTLGKADVFQVLRGKLRLLEEAVVDPFLPLWNCKDTENGSKGGDRYYQKSTGSFRCRNGDFQACYA